MTRVRKSGILLHPTSLPGKEGIGTLGREAYRFVDFLVSARQSIWQVLPLGPAGCGNSPYSCFSAFAGNPLMIDIEALVGEGDLPPTDYPPLTKGDRIDFDMVLNWKLPLLRQAAERFFSGTANHRLAEFHRFCNETFWLHDYALFMALKEANGGKGWNEWPEDIRSRSYPAIEAYSEQLGKSIGEHKYMQWQFFQQWRRVKEYANAAGVEIFGDIPIFVAYDSADVWANPHLFRLNENGSPIVVAGVPPDYFSATGQLWGNPLYDWNALASHGYSWWIERVRCSLNLYDILRIDHFRGFAAYWEVPASETTAINGRWVEGPGHHFFQALGGTLGELPIVAEDLGVITPDVEELRDTFSLPGMKILQFAFDSGPDNPYLPHNHIPLSIVYTGTHDNDTTVGWFEAQGEKQKKRILHYINTHGEDIAWEMIRVALASVADRAIIPLQDVLGLGTEAKMNKPGTADGNWSWRYLPGQVTDSHARALAELTELFGRAPKKQ